MTNEVNLDSMTLEERTRLRKQMTDQAVKLAISSRWEEAATLNREYLKIFGDDPDALNRLGKALTEMGEITEARNSYGRAIELDPANTIARRNLDKLATMEDRVMAAPPTQLDTRLFIEETAKATVATLQAVSTERSALLDAGDIVELRVEGNAVNAIDTEGEYIGMIEPRIGLRLSRLMQGGNRYSAALVTTTGEMKVMIRETFQHPTQIGKVSFPQARATEVRAYTRRGLLRGEEIDYGEDDEGEEEESNEGWSEEGAEELDTESPVVDIETEDESYD
ncbi:MAG TPA: tetratricopeptide repeat protein [Tepidiformaceae bacterium]|nr:tetratricopeptide repeat protein [Tepidiformaceae bacterium]HSE46773.1 tetratricopeptide repeat protein [Gemmatimonadales bacterium]